MVALTRPVEHVRCCLPFAEGLLAVVVALAGQCSVAVGPTPSEYTNPHHTLHSIYVSPSPLSVITCYMTPPHLSLVVRVTTATVLLEAMLLGMLLGLLTSLFDVVCDRCPGNTYETDDTVEKKRPPHIDGGERETVFVVFSNDVGTHLCRTLSHGPR
mmetsp:Transcript_11310/g.26311  ORF Transcript_11310/g.26311 Transcript_11310/m.26311 type:complete len:157 (-) Transcript_11310:236-706(-)